MILGAPQTVPSAIIDTSARQTTGVTDYTYTKQAPMTYSKEKLMEVEQLVALLKAIAVPQRLKILSALSQENLVVAMIAERTKMSQPLASYHLRILHDFGFVGYATVDSCHYYFLCRDQVRSVAEELSKLLCGEKEQNQ